MNQFAKPGLAEEKLPPVSTADNGKVLGVNNGVWDKVAASGGSDLPEVTADDKDKYLHTNSSTGDLEWSAVSGGGGGNIVVAKFERTVSSDGTTVTTTCDKTFAELDTARTQGADVIGVILVADDNHGYYFNEMFFMVYSPESAFPFPAAAQFSGAAVSYAPDAQTLVYCGVDITANATNNIHLSVEAIQ